MNVFLHTILILIVSPPFFQVVVGPSSDLEKIFEIGRRRYSIKKLPGYA